MAVAGGGGGRGAASETVTESINGEKRQMDSDG